MVDIAAITLHVGYGTFQPVRVDEVEAHRLDPERYDISPATALEINRALDEGRALLLFDGLDEVADSKVRRRLANSLHSLAEDSAGNRIVIGSRPAGLSGCEGSLRPQSFRHCDIARFTPNRFALAGAGLSVGRDASGLAVCDDYVAPFPFTGTIIGDVTVDVDGDRYVDPEGEAAVAIATQ